MSDCPATLQDLLPLQAAGFAGGRESLHQFVGHAFGPEGPRFLKAEDGSLAVFRNRDLHALAIHPAVGAVPPAVLFGPEIDPVSRAEPPPGADLAWVISNQVFTANPPIHKPVRKAFAGHLGPKQVREMEPLAREVVADILDAVQAAVQLDAATEIAERLACEFWGRLLDFTAAEIREMEQYVRDLAPMFFFSRTEADLRRLISGAAGYRRLITQSVSRSLSAGGNAFINAMSADLACIDLPSDLSRTGMVPRDVAMMLAGNLVDGFHTSAVAAANTLFVLMHNREAMAAIQSDATLVMPAIFEALRLEPPVIMLKRWALDDFEYEGLSVPAGAEISMLWGAGAHDPLAFADPARFDLNRSRQGSTTFGGGVHLCPGRNAAPMLIRVLLEGMIQRGLELVPSERPARWIPRHLMCQLESLPACVVRQSSPTAAAGATA